MASSQTPSPHLKAPSSLADVRSRWKATCGWRCRAAKRWRGDPDPLHRPRPPRRSAARDAGRNRSPAAGSPGARTRPLEEDDRQHPVAVESSLSHLSDAPALPPHGTALSANWAELYGKLTELRLHHGLSRFIRIASFRGIAPEQVDDAFLQEVLRSVKTINWGRDTLPFWRKTVMLWNEAIDSVPGWPPQRLTPPPESPRTRHLRLDDLPATFRQDLAAYLNWASGVDRFADDAPTTPLKASTLRQRQEHLRLAASTLATCLGSPLQVERLAMLVMPANMRAILSRYLAATEDQQPTTFIRRLAVTLPPLPATGSRYRRRSWRS